MEIEEIPEYRAAEQAANDLDKVECSQEFYRKMLLALIGHCKMLIRASEESEEMNG